MPCPITSCLYVLLSPLCPALRDSPICAFSQSKSCPSPPPTRLRLLLALSSRLLTALRSHCVALTARCYASAPLPIVQYACSFPPILLCLPFCHAALPCASLAILFLSALCAAPHCFSPLCPVRASTFARFLSLYLSSASTCALSNIS